MRTLTMIAAALGMTAATGLTHSASAGDKVHILVLKEHGIGSPRSAQPYVDKLVDVAADENDWSDAEGKYITSRRRARIYIDKKDPEFGILSLPSFLAMRKKHGLVVLGKVHATSTGGRKYHLISKNASSLGECKGKSLASNHADDERFVDGVVFRGAAELDDFDLNKTRRPVQTLKKVTRGKAVCALVDDAQLAELKHIDGGSSVDSVWSSKTLPPMAVVGFSSSSAASRAKFKASLGSLCSGAGKTHCDKVGIKSLAPASNADYRSAIAAYDG